MNIRSNTLELLAPAKNADFGIEAVLHGADAVYIGGPAFGARYGADNTLQDIARLVDYAHRYHARVFVAVNTILHDHELEPAQKLCWTLHEAGVDALILQDMGLLECDLPPIQLHASTQTDIRTPEKARFLQDVGFSQIVLARELNLDQIHRIAAQTDCTLEFFIHGALCVAYSGQCYISHAHTGRSANRGECSQACRLPYTVADNEGRVIATDQHVLSMKDNDQSANLDALIAAGIRSFKIEGRLKDLSYVKNITAHYRQLLDAYLEKHPDFRASAHGQCTYTFQPVPEKTFNRGSTDYFVRGRQADIGAFASPAFVGVPVGQVQRVHPDRRAFDINALAPLSNGDGLAFYGPKGELSGLRINRVEGKRIELATPLPTTCVPGTPLFRNHDHAFERALRQKSADRRILIDFLLTETPQGFLLSVTDEVGISAQSQCHLTKTPANTPHEAFEALRKNLSKLGETFFKANRIDFNLTQPWFIPPASINALRREALPALVSARQAACRPLLRRPPVSPPVPYPQTDLTYLANILNDAARRFYRRHGVQFMEPAYELDQHTGEASLMITKHCIRYSFNLCPKQVKGIRPDPMVLIQGKDRLTLRFDCKPCEMHVIGKRRQAAAKTVQWLTQAPSNKK